MNIKLCSVDIKNYCGIKSCKIQGFGQFNVIVGSNGIGKTSLQKVIARLLPALRGDDNIFLDGDFCFETKETAPNIAIEYVFEFSLNDNQESKKYRLSVNSIRNSKGKSNGNLNVGYPAKQSIRLYDYISGEEIDKSKIIQEIKSQDVKFRTNVLLHPIRTFENKSSGHASTYELPNTTEDWVRSRIIELLNDGKQSKNVKTRHGKNFPERIMNKFNELRGYQQLIHVEKGSDESYPIFQTSKNTWVRWDQLSSGEKSLFAIIMIDEMMSLENVKFLIIEEPENCLHVGMQATILRRLLDASNQAQVFLSTHSTGFLEVPKSDLYIKHFLLAQDNGELKGIDVTKLQSTSVLEQLGMTARSIGQAKYRIFVEGISDAIFFQACIEQLITESLQYDLSNLLEFVICGGPSTIKKHGELNQELVGSALHKINLSRPGVMQYIIFDSDSDNQDTVNQNVQKLKKSLKVVDTNNLKVMSVCYNTLESLYDEDIWVHIYSDKIKNNNLPPFSTRCWWKPKKILRELFIDPPADSTFRNSKVEIAIKAAEFVRANKWAVKNREYLGFIEEIACEINGNKK